MYGGEIQQLDTPQAIYNKPVNRFVAGFIGSPRLKFFLRGVGGENGRPLPPGGIFLSLHPHWFAQKRRAPHATARPRVRARRIVQGEAASRQPFSKEVDVEVVEPMGSDTLVWGKLGGHNLSFRVEAEKPLNVGDRILIGFDPGRASLFDGANGRRL